MTIFHGGTGLMRGDWRALWLVDLYEGFVLDVLYIGSLG
jgi:hypothetical protein